MNILASIIKEFAPPEVNYIKETIADVEERFEKFSKDFDQEQKREEDYEFLRGIMTDNV